MTKCKTLAALQTLHQFVIENCRTYPDDSEEKVKEVMLKCLSEKIELERKYHIAVIEEQHIACLVEAEQWLWQEKTMADEWHEPLLKRAMQLTSPNPTLHMLLGTIFGLVGRRAEAVEQYKQAETLTSDLAPIQHIVAFTRDPAIQLEYAQKWEGREESEVASRIVRYVSETGEISPTEMKNAVPKVNLLNLASELDNLT